MSMTTDEVRTAIDQALVAADIHKAKGRSYQEVDRAAYAAALTDVALAIALERDDLRRLLDRVLDEHPPRGWDVDIA